MTAGRSDGDRSKTADSDQTPPDRYHECTVGYQKTRFV
jgi:hypothetical protein